MSTKELTDKEKIEQDALALAQLIYDIWKDKKQKEQSENDDAPTIT